MPLIFSHPVSSPTSSPPPITRSPSVRELIAQVEATSRVPFWRDPKQNQPRRSLYHTLSRILVSDLSSDEDFSHSYTSESLEGSYQASLPPTLAPESEPSSPILRNTLIHKLEISSRLSSGTARIPQSFEAETFCSSRDRSSVSSLRLAADATADTSPRELPSITPGSPLIIQFVDSLPDYRFEIKSGEGVEDLTPGQVHSSAQSVLSYYFLQDFSEERIPDAILDPSLSRCQSFPQPATPEHTLEPGNQVVGDIVVLDLNKYHSPSQPAIGSSSEESHEAQLVDNQGGDGTVDSIPGTFSHETSNSYGEAPAELCSVCDNPSGTSNLQAISSQKPYNCQEEGALKSELHLPGSSLLSYTTSSGEGNLGYHSSRKSSRAPNLSTVPESLLSSENPAAVEDLYLPTNRSYNSSREQQPKSAVASRSFSHQLRVIPPRPAVLYLPQYLIDELKSFDPVDILQLDPDSPIGGNPALPMSSSAPKGASANDKDRPTSVGTRAIKISEANQRESCCEDEELKGKEKPNGSENQSPATDSSEIGIKMAKANPESDNPPKDKSDKAEEKAKKKVERVKKTVGKVIHKSRSLALQKPVLVIVLGRPLAGPVHDNLVTIADGEIPDVAGALGNAASGGVPKPPALAPVPV